MRRQQKISRKAAISSCGRNNLRTRLVRTVLPTFVQIQLPHLCISEKMASSNFLLFLHFCVQVFKGSIRIRNCFFRKLQFVCAGDDNWNKPRELSFQRAASVRSQRRTSTAILPRRSVPPSPEGTNCLCIHLGVVSTASVWLNLEAEGKYLRRSWTSTSGHFWSEPCFKRAPARPTQVQVR